MKKYCVLIFFFLVTAMLSGASDDTSKIKSKATASLEIGADSIERRYLRPYFRFDFPLNVGILFIESYYYQRTNSRLKGEIDFWIRAALERKISSAFSIQASINHMSRHHTSTYNPEIFDLNEIVGKFLYKNKNIEIGLGAGGYLGKNSRYRNLGVFHLEWSSISNTEFSAKADIKLINQKELLHEFELSCALDESLDLFVRNTKHYEYKNTTFLGLRLKAEGKAQNYASKFKVRPEVYPSNENHKMAIIKEIKLEFFNSQQSRVILSFSSKLPILRSKGFFGRFRPENIIYPLSLEYQRKARKDLIVSGYCKYQILMPIDVDREFESSLGIGLVLRNQIHFEKLEKKFRYELFGGHNFSHSYDAGVRLGLNTVREGMDFGLELRLRSNTREFYGLIEVFGEFGKGIKVRPFFALEKFDLLGENGSSKEKFLFGIAFFRWLH